MGEPARRVIRMDEFKRQIAEAVLTDDHLVEVEAAPGKSVWIKIPLNLDDDDDYPQRLRAAKGGEDLALVILSGHPDRTAQQQWEEWTSAGLTAGDLAVVFGTESQAAQERLGNFRYR